MFALLVEGRKVLKAGKRENQDESKANWRLGLSLSLSFSPFSHLYSHWPLSGRLCYFSPLLHVRRVCVCTVCVCSGCSTATFDDATLTDESSHETPSRVRWDERERERERAKWRGGWRCEKGKEEKMKVNVPQYKGDEDDDDDRENDDSFSHPIHIACWWTGKKEERARKNFQLFKDADEFVYWFWMARISCHLHFTFFLSQFTLLRVDVVHWINCVLMDGIWLVLLSGTMVAHCSLHHLIHSPFSLSKVVTLVLVKYRKVHSQCLVRLLCYKFYSWWPIKCHSWWRNGQKDESTKTSSLWTLVWRLKHLQW